MAYSTINKHTDYFNTKLWTGNGSAGHAITGVGHQPDLTWIKVRGSAGDNGLWDSVRGVSKRIQSNENSAETTTSGVTAFGTDGFTMGTAYNVNNDNYASWNWKAGTTGSGTTTGAGTGKAYSYSVNTTAGFSIVKYLGNGTVNHTIPHHLGVAPKMIITKNLDSGVTWIVGHDSITWANILFLDTDASKSDDSNAFNDVAPTSTVWNVGGGNGNNSDNVNYVSYCFAEKTGYSKFGQYVGNSNSNGTFVYCGFKPSLILIKVHDGTNNWHIYDNKREGYNVDNDMLRPNLNSAEQTDDDIDILSNGFKLRRSTTAFNGSSNTYIYMAIGQSLVGSNNIPCTAR
jgi:hypothetical protein